MTIHTTHNSQTRVAESGKFKKQLTLTDLTFIGLGAIFGSGWLFAASHVASIAGPAGIASWVIGGFAVLLLGIVYCELGAALPRAGGIIRYPVFSHGELMGYLLGFITLIAFSSLISIEIVAARQYAAAWFPALTLPGSSSPTLLGCLFGFVAGIMVFISLDELLPAAEEYGEHHISIYGVVTGMALMAVSLIVFS